MQKNITSLCYKNACINIQGKAADAINTIIFIGVLAIVLAAVSKAFR